MSDPIPFLPRPWRVVRRAGLEPSIQDAGGAGVFRVYSSDIHEQADVAEHIVRLVNAEPEVIAALEAAAALRSDSCSPECAKRRAAFPHVVNGPCIHVTEALNQVRAALAKLRG